MWVVRNKAAKIMGLTVDRLRGMEKRKEVEWRKTKNGHVEINVDDSMCEQITDDARLKKAKADMAELDLAKRKGEYAREMLELHRECLMDGLPLFKEALCELSLSESDQKRVHDGLYAWIARYKENIRNAITKATETKESEA